MTRAQRIAVLAFAAHLARHAIRRAVHAWLAALCAWCAAPQARAEAPDAAALAPADDEVDLALDDALAAAPPVPTVAQAAVVGDDELWFVSSRRARYTPTGPEGLQVWKYDGAGSWNAATLDELAAADPAVPNCFHVHGNRVGWGQSNCGGWQFYSTLTDCAAPRKPLRFVIFSWPSAGQWGSQRDDVRAKAVVAESHAYFLAAVVARLPAESQVGVIGYSYGARVIGGALHLLGGGRLRGRSLGDDVTAAPRRVRAVMLAAALDSGSFLQGRTFSQAPSQIDRLLVCRNSADKVMKWYPLLYQVMLRPQRGVQAMGYVGVGGLSCLPQLAGRVEHVDVACVVGNNHEWHGYEYLRGSLATQIREVVTFADPVEHTAEQAPAEPVVTETAAR